MTHELRQLERKAAVAYVRTIDLYPMAAKGRLEQGVVRVRSTLLGTKWVFVTDAMRKAADVSAYWRVYLNHHLF